MTSEVDGIRLRRTKSVTRAEEIVKNEAKVRRSQPDKPCHRPRDSLFSWTSGFNNFTGFVNWGFLLLTMGGIRLLLENLIKYGIRVDPVQWFIVLTGSEEGGPYRPSLYLFFYSAVPVMLCLRIERGLSEDIISPKIGMTAHLINLCLLVMLPMIVIHFKSALFSLMGATMVCFIYSVLFLKLWSYIQVNMWCRTGRYSTSKANFRRQSMSFSALSGDAQGEDEVKSSGKTESSSKLLTTSKSLDGNGHKVGEEDEEYHIVKYPENLTAKDLVYFLFAPTLCYELNFPKTDRIRKRFLLKRIVEVVLLLQLVMCLFQQWIIPSVKNSLIPFSNMDLMKATERLLKLSIPNHLVWLIFFYVVFHSFLNLMGELLHFADRNFYCDWWNANNIDVFWRTWNMPVHRWAVRHLYIPMVELGYGKTAASSMVFFISAFFHEYLVSVPLQTFKVWAFMGMMAQVPLSILSRTVEKSCGPRFGNLIVWSSLILGQPLCIMMYYHDYVITHYGESLIDSYGTV